MKQVLRLVLGGGGGPEPATMLAILYVDINVIITDRGQKVHHNVKKNEVISEHEFVVMLCRIIYILFMHLVRLTKLKKKKLFIHIHKQ